MRKLRSLLVGLSCLAVIAATKTARAEASAWVFVGGGAIAWKQSPGKFLVYPAGKIPPVQVIDPTTSFAVNGTLTFDAGVGTSPDGRFIIGGLMSLRPIIGLGPDVSAMARFATHGFQAGDFGLAIDAGGYARGWGVGSFGFAGRVALGAPLGFTLMLESQVGTNHALGFGATLGIDVLRLTVYRQTLLDKWPNPSPAWRKRSDKPE